MPCPVVRSIDVGTPADFATEKSWDLLLLLRFDDLDAVDAYRAHENHVRYMDTFLRPMLGDDQGVELRAALSGARRSAPLAA